MPPPTMLQSWSGFDQYSGPSHTRSGHVFHLLTKSEAAGAAAARSGAFRPPATAAVAATAAELDRKRRRVRLRAGLGIGGENVRAKAPGFKRQKGWQQKTAGPRSMSTTELSPPLASTTAN